MYSYNSIPKYNQNMYYQNGVYQNKGYQTSPNGDRFIGGGLLAPLFLGGVAGYAIGYNRPNNYNYMPPYQPMPVYTNNYYYPYYY